MDAAPLSKAHDHARAASDATRSSDSTVAISEHALAAGEFSNAARSTSSIEALRTLKLLEEHHKRLSELLQLPLEPTSQQSTGESDTGGSDEKQSPTGTDAPANDKPDGPGNDATGHASPAAAKQKPTLSQQQRRFATRDMTSSIASNLATARGIRTGRRGQPLIPSVSNDQAPGSLEVHPRKDGTVPQGDERPDQTRTPSWVPPVPVAPAVSEPQQTRPSAKTEERPASPANNDDGFSRFYNTFGSIFNRLSAPLAFAGLPLITEESTTSDSAPSSPPEQTNPRRSRARLPQTVSTEPDLSKIYSKATMRALHSTGNGPNDSFYVVPTSGHTASYASILSFDQKEKRRIAASVHGGGDSHNPSIMEDMDEDVFVDARDVPVSAALRQRLGKDKSDKKAHNVIEELHLENAHLKEMLDKVSKRLHAFEIGSQSSHLALAQSLRMTRPGSPMSSSGGAGGSGGAGLGKMDVDEAVKKRNRELEEQLSRAVRRIEDLEQEQGKMQVTLEKYRERWEKLKAGAKARREKGSTANDGDASRA